MRDSGSSIGSRPGRSLGREILSTPDPAPLGGCTINTLILLLFGLTLVVFLGIAVLRMVSYQRREREDARSDGFPSGERPRTDEQKAKDKRAASIWGGLAVLVPCLLVLAYYVSR